VIAVIKETKACSPRISRIIRPNQ